MSEFGSCSEPLCHETSVRLFDCIHHCKKLVCLQHLIEHDRIIEYQQDCTNQVHLELKQLWLTYSSLIDETKLRLEFEEQLNQHRQLIKEISNLFEINSINMEQYQLLIEKIQFNIEQEKQRDQHSIQSVSQSDLVKIEPSEMISTNEEMDMLDMNLATRLQRLHSNLSQQQQQSISNSSTMNESPTSEHANNHTSLTNSSHVRTLASACPFWFDGAFGLHEDSHGMYICTPRKYAYLFNHLLDFHKFKRSCAEQICLALLADKDPSKEILFQSTDIVIDKTNNYLCPFSIHHSKQNQIFNSAEYSCSRTKPASLARLHHHFTRDHHMTRAIADSFVDKLKKLNSKN